MRHMEVTIYEPGDLLAVADYEGKTTLYRVLADGSLAPTSESTSAEAFHRPDNRMAEVTLDSTLDEWSQAWGLSVRPYNVLAREGIKTWRALVDLYDRRGSEGLSEMRNMGSKAQDEVIAAIYEWRRAE